MVRRTRWLEVRLANEEDAALRQPQIAESRLLREWPGRARILPVDRRAACGDHPHDVGIGLKLLAVGHSAVEAERASLEKRPSKLSQYRKSGGASPQRTRCSSTYKIH
jgi:hypothetical protein